MKPFGVTFPLSDNVGKWEKVQSYSDFSSMLLSLLIGCTDGHGRGWMGSQDYTLDVTPSFMDGKDV